MLCVHCKKIEVDRNQPFWPFCSERCRTLDLGAWANEKYRIAGEKAEDVEDELPEAEDGDGADDDEP